MVNRLAFVIWIFLCSTFVLRSSAQKPDSLHFFKGTWKQALQKSKKAGKPLFVDFYASYCAPCKKMASETFTNKQVYSYINKNFIPYQVDVESFDGYPVSAQYKVKTMPKIILIDSHEKALKEIDGFYQADNLVEIIKKSGFGH